MAAVTLPLLYVGSGAFKVASPYHAKRCEDAYGQGEIITVEEVQERSAKSHAHYFAMVAEGWKNLPERITDDFPSSEHLRKWALIKAGYCTKNSMVFRTNAEAIAAAAFIGQLDTYAVIEVSGRVVTIWRAESQSKKAMKGERFQQSKDDVLRVIGELLRADPASIEEAA